MSAGAFSKSKYQTTLLDADDNPYIVPIRIQPETASLTIATVGNGAPAGAINLPVSAVVSRGRRARGIIPRTVTIENTDPDATGGYKTGGVITLPCLTPAIFNAAKAAISSTTVSYLGRTTWKVSYTSDEIVK